MTPAALASSLWEAADSHPTEATACSFAFFLGLNACVRRLARPHTPTLFGSRGGGQQGGRGRPHGDELLGVFVNHTVTLVHVALAVCGVWHMFVREQGLEVLSRDPLVSQRQPSPLFLGRFAPVLRRFSAVILCCLASWRRDGENGRKMAENGRNLGEKRARNSGG